VLGDLVAVYMFILDHSDRFYTLYTTMIWMMDADADS
jgi:hypothetical protein